MTRPVTLSPEQALSVLNTLTYADSYLLNMLAQTESSASLRDELLEIRRMIARQFNGKPA